MKLLSSVILAGTLLVLVACSGGDKTSVATEEAMQAWAEFAAATVDEYFSNNPENAVDAGLYDYDGQASDFSLAAIAEYTSWLDSVIEAASAYSDLEGIEAFERDYLMQALRGERWFIRDSGFVRNNPVLYARALSFSVYVDREYAPLEERIVAYTNYISHVPRILEQMQENLVRPMPSPYVETANRAFRRLAALNLQDAILGAGARRKFRTGFIYHVQIALKIHFACRFQVRQRNVDSLSFAQHVQEPLLAQREIVGRCVPVAIQPLGGCAHGLYCRVVRGGKLSLQSIVFNGRKQFSVPCSAPSLR